MKTIALLFASLATFVASAQERSVDLKKLQAAKKLSVVNRTLGVTEKGVKLDEGSGEGVAWLDGVTFGNGTVHIDLRGRDVQGKSFVGIAFHGVNDSTYDAVYFRPFNFHATDPVRKIHAVQYISHPVFTWKKLRDEHNGMYEKALLAPPDPNGWFHARIEVYGENVSVYVNDDKVPSLTVKKLSATRTGKLGLWVGDGSDGEFANVVIQK